MNYLTILIINYNYRQDKNAITHKARSRHLLYINKHINCNIHVRTLNMCRMLRNWLRANITELFHCYRQSSPNSLHHQYLLLRRMFKYSCSPLLPYISIPTSQLLY